MLKSSCCSGYSTVQQLPPWLSQTQQPPVLRPCESLTNKLWCQNLTLEEILFLYPAPYSLPAWESESLATGSCCEYYPQEVNRFHLYRENCSLLLWLELCWEPTTSCYTSVPLSMALICFHINFLHSRNPSPCLPSFTKSFHSDTH